MENHWENDSTMLNYLEKILFPYIQLKRKDLKLAIDHPALVIFDRFSAQCTDAILHLFGEHQVRLVIVPANCTDRLQPLDILVNKAAKDFLRKEFQDWYMYAHQVYIQIQRQCQECTITPITPVDLWMGIMKPLGAKWTTSLFKYLQGKPEIIKNSFRESGIVN